MLESVTNAQHADILVVEDSSHLAMLLSRILDSQGYRVMSVTDGHQALETAHRQPPDLIVLDIMLPGMDGFEVCKHLKANPATHDIPVIFISARDESVDKVRAFSVGGVDYITKPFHPEEVLARIATHLALRMSHRQLQEQHTRLQQEIARREQAEESLRKSQALLDAFLEHAPTAAFATDLSGKILLVNRQLAALLGYTPDQLTDRFQWDVFPPDHVVRWQQEYQQMLSSGRPMATEENITTACDGERIYLTTKFPIHDEQGFIYAIGGMSTDITERKQMEEAVRISERRYRLVTDLITDYVYSFRIELDGTFVREWGFEGFTRLTGYRIDEVELQGWDQMIHSDDRHLLRHQMERSLQGQSVVTEMRIITRAGEIRWIRYHSQPEWDAQQGRVIRIYGAVQDITERKHAEAALQALNTELEQRVNIRTVQLKVTNQKLRQEVNERKQAEVALRQSEARFRTLVETANAAILIICANQRLCYANTAAEVITGYSRDTLLQMALHDLLHPDFRTLFPEHAMMTGEEVQVPARYEVQFLTRAGQVRWVTLSFAGVMYDGRHGMLLTAFDITERKQAEHALNVANAHLAEANTALRRSRDLLRALFDGLEDGFLLLDGKGCIQTANRAIATLLETTPEEMVNRHWSDLEAQSWNAQTLPFIPPAAGQRSAQRIRYRRSNGTMCVLDLSIIMLGSGTQAVEQVIVHVVDVTELVQLQANVIENERFAASGRLAASVAHEINTPLQSIQTFLELLRIATEQDRSMFLTHAIEETQRVGRIVRQLLDLYRPTATHIGPVDVNALIERLLLLTGKRSRDQGIMIKCTLAEQLPAIWGRADELMQVVLNLLINAIEAMPNGGILHVLTEWTDQVSHPAGTPTLTDNGAGFLLIKIIDSGQGISPDLESSVFNPFFTTKENGTGLGLSISAQLVQQLGGSISLESQVGSGCTFTIMLPCVNKGLSSQPHSDTRRTMHPILTGYSNEESTLCDPTS